MRLVFIDDEEAILTMLKCLYEIDYPQAKFFESPADAMVYINENISDIDLIVSDYKMPTSSGFNVYEHVRKKSKSVPFIFYSAYITSDFMKEVSEIDGECNFVIKPGAKELSKKINSILLK